MTCVTALILIAVFLSGAVIGVLAILVAAIRSDDRAMNLTGPARTRTGAATRRLLGVGVRTAEAGHGEGHEPDSPESDLT